MPSRSYSEAWITIRRRFQVGFERARRTKPIRLHPSWTRRWTWDEKWSDQKLHGNHLGLVALLALSLLIPADMFLRHLVEDRWIFLRTLFLVILPCTLPLATTGFSFAASRTAWANGHPFTSLAYKCLAAVTLLTMLLILLYPSSKFRVDFALLRRLLD